MKTILTVLIGLFLLTSCTQDEALRIEETLNGTYIGTFTGDADGVFEAKVEDGIITGTTKIGEDVIDTFEGVLENGTFIAYGDVSTGAEYNGTVNEQGIVQGTWEKDSEDLLGTFTGQKQ